MRPIEELAAEICTLAGHINAANHRWLLLIAEFDRRNGWADGAHAVVRALAELEVRHRDGRGAREGARRACAREPAEGLRGDGERRLSYSKVREITRVATPQTEDYLLMIAEHGTAQHVERLVRAYRRCQEAEELSREQRQQQNRRVSFRYDDDGSLVLDLPAAGRGRRAVHEGARHRGGRTADRDVPAGTSKEVVRFSARRADALALVAESFLAHGAHRSRRHRAPADRRARGRRKRCATGTAGCCEFEHGPSMAAETARRFSCDASVVVLDRKTMTASRSTWAARRGPFPRHCAALLKARDKGCRFPGCANSRYIDVHHIEHWANGGETKPSNLVSLCRFHHRAVHEGGIRIERFDDGALRFVRADGEPVDDVAPGFTQPPGDWRQLPEGTLVNRWRGERMDYNTAIDALIYKTGTGEGRSSWNVCPRLASKNHADFLPPTRRRAVNGFCNFQATCVAEFSALAKNPDFDASAAWLFAY